MRCTVREIVGENAITLDDGQAVFDRIKADLTAGHVVELDFDGVSIFASPFFNAAIGQLLHDFSADQLNQRLRVVNLSPVGLDVLRRVIDNAKEYYSAADYREAQRHVIEAMAQET